MISLNSPEVRTMIGNLYLAMLLAVGYASALPAQSNCRPADDRSASLIAELSKWMVESDPVAVAHRDTLFKIPVVAPSTITLVSNQNACAKAINAYAAPGAGRVYVISLNGQYFAVLDPTYLAGEYQTVKIFSKNWKLIGGWTG